MVPRQQLVSQRLQNQGDDRGFQEAAEGGVTTPYTSRELQWRESPTSNSSVCTSRMTSPGPCKRTRLYFLRRLEKFGMSPKTLKNFYRCTIESILSGCITAWYGSCSAADRKARQRVVKTAERIIGGHLPSVQGIYNSRCLRKARNTPRLWSIHNATVW